jgi:hypothetical protein
MRFSIHLNGELVMVMVFGIKVNSWIARFLTIFVLYVQSLIAFESLWLKTRCVELCSGGLAELAIWQNKHLMKQLQNLTP